MRRAWPWIAISFVLVSVDALLARAEPLEAPYWSIQYDLSGSTVEVSDTPLGLWDGTFTLWGKGTSTDPGKGEVGVSPGTMTLQLPDCGGVVCTGSGSVPARLVAFELEQHFEILVPSFASLYVDSVAELSGDASGTYDGALSIAWQPTAPSGWRNTGLVACIGTSMFCGNLDLQPGDNPFDVSAEEPIGLFTFEASPTAGVDLSAEWTTAAPPFGGSATFRYHLVATETTRTLVPASTPVPLGSLVLFGSALTVFGTAMLTRAKRPTSDGGR